MREGNRNLDLDSRQSTESDLELWMNRIRTIKQQTYRTVALQELMRSDQGGAFVNLVAGSPAPPHQSAAAVDTDEGKGLDNELFSSNNSSSDAQPKNKAQNRGLNQHNAQASAPITPRDRRKATNLVSGVTRWQRKLAWILSNLPKKTSLATMDAPLRLILFMATYELLHTGMAPHASNEYVDLTKKVLHEGAAKVTNGVLRTVNRCKDAGEVPKPPMPKKGCTMNEAAEALGVATSHPTWLVRKWLKIFGAKDTIALLKKNNSVPQYSMRLVHSVASQDRSSPHKERGEPLVNAQDGSSMVSAAIVSVHAAIHASNEGDPEGDSATGSSGSTRLRPSKYLPDEFLVIESGLQRVLRTGIVAQGRGQVQDEAAGLVVALLDPRPGDAVLDCCAAPGGKSLFSAARMNGRGTLVALDSSKTRLEALRNTAKLQNILPTTVYNHLSSDTAEEHEGRAGNNFTLRIAVGDCRGYCVNAAAAGDLYDKVLVDAPCSGTGVLSKRADLRWRRKEEDIAQLSSLQEEMLHAAAQVVRPGGGVLVYSTCSIEDEENSMVVKKFLETHPEFEIVNGAGLVAEECLNKEGMLCMLPHVHGTDGAFACRMMRK